MRNGHVLLTVLAFVWLTGCAENADADNNDLAFPSEGKAEFVGDDLNCDGVADDDLCPLPELGGALLEREGIAGTRAESCQDPQEGRVVTSFTIFENVVTVWRFSNSDGLQRRGVFASMGSSIFGREGFVLAGGNYVVKAWPEGDPTPE